MKILHHTRDSIKVAQYTIRPVIATCQESVHIFEAYDWITQETLLLKKIELGPVSQILISYCSVSETVTTLILICCPHATMPLWQ